MSIRKIRKAGQVKVFYSATYFGFGCFMYFKNYGLNRLYMPKYDKK